MHASTFLILGASGDLAKRKLIPALCKLVEQHKLSNFLIVGAALDDTSAQAIFEQALPYLNHVDTATIEQVKERFFYHQLNFLRSHDFISLRSLLDQKEAQCKLPGNRIIFLAAASEFYCPITQYLAESGIAQREAKNRTSWQRIVYEKPFGRDAASAQEINDFIARFFDEAQIFRIDHYLTKELVGNIALVRFTNCVLEPLWNNRYIDNVQITVSETLGIENRGAYYDRYGALADMVQNHLLELVALIAMESPERLSGDYIRTERAKVLERIKVIDAILGQYDGYVKEPHVAAQSTTDTYALIYLMIENHRWAGVPFYIKTGKNLDKKETVIHIKFKQVDCLLARHCPSESNYLTIQIAPEATFFLTLNVKKPGKADEVTPVKMEFCHSCLFGNVTPESYEVIFEEIMRGEQSVSVRFDEIEFAWRVIDTVRAHKFPLYRYKPGSKGPQEAEVFAKKHGIRWRI